jgi:hypothetical protein
VRGRLATSPRPSTLGGEGLASAHFARRPPIITWSDVRWTLFIVAGIAFLYGLGAIIIESVRIGGVSGTIIFAATFIIELALIALELRRFWLRYRR